MEENWGKKEVDMILEELRQKGEYKMRAEIKKEIKDQDKELVKIQFYVLIQLKKKGLLKFFKKKVTLETILLELLRLGTKS